MLNFGVWGKNCELIWFTVLTDQFQLHINLHNDEHTYIHSAQDKHCLHVSVLSNIANRARPGRREPFINLNRADMGGRICRWGAIRPVGIPVAPRILDPMSCLSWHLHLGISNHIWSKLGALRWWWGELSEHRRCKMSSHRRPTKEARVDNQS